VKYQSDKESWPCPDDCSGAPGADCANKHAAQADEHNGKYRIAST